MDSGAIAPESGTTGTDFGATEIGPGTTGMGSRTIVPGLGTMGTFIRMNILAYTIIRMEVGTTGSGLGAIGMELGATGTDLGAIVFMSGTVVAKRIQIGMESIPIGMKGVPYGVAFMRMATRSPPAEEMWPRASPDGDQVSPSRAILDGLKNLTGRSIARVRRNTATFGARVALTVQRSTPDRIESPCHGPISRNREGKRRIRAPEQTSELYSTLSVSQNRGRESYSMIKEVRDCPDTPAGEIHLLDRRIHIWDSR
jgi:hypothetical protein